MTKVEAQSLSVDAILKEGAKQAPSHLGPVDRGYWAIHAFARGKINSGQVGIAPGSCADFVTLDSKGRQVPVGGRLVALVNSTATGLAGKIPTTFEEGISLIMGSELVRKPISLDTPLDRYGSDEDVFGDFVADPSIDVAEVVVKKIDLEMLRKALPTLSQDEIAILRKRFGEGKSLASIASDYDVHHRTITNRITSACRKLRDVLGEKV